MRGPTTRTTAGSMRIRPEARSRAPTRRELRSSASSTPRTRVKRRTGQARRPGVNVPRRARHALAVDSQLFEEVGDALRGMLPSGLGELRMRVRRYGIK